VSRSPSTTRPFDAPEFILTLRCRHPRVGTVFCPRVLYSLNPPFWPISGTLQLPVSVVLHYISEFLRLTNSTTSEIKVSTLQHQNPPSLPVERQAPKSATDKPIGQIDRLRVLGLGQRLPDRGVLPARARFCSPENCTENLELPS
jgi:hypothetical protein